MVTIGTCALVVLALAVFVYCEYNNYWHSPANDKGLKELIENAGENSADSKQKLTALTAQFEIEHKNIASLSSKFGAIWRFVNFVLFNSKEQKQERIRRNELTAEKLLLEYQSLVRLPGTERVDRFIRWRDDVSDYEQRQKTEHGYRVRMKDQDQN